MPPNEEALYERLRNRKTESEEVIETRIKTSREEIANSDIYDEIIVNETGKSDVSADIIYNLLN